MRPVALYQFIEDKVAFQLRYTWTGWPSSGELPEVDLEAVKPLWETDGLRLLECRQTSREVQLAFSALPAVSPTFLAARAKGRLQHAIRNSGRRFSGFSRKVAVRSVGDNTTADVEAYIARQVRHACFADPRFEAELAKYTICCPEVDLRQASESSHGRYWYNLHVVPVVAERGWITDGSTLAAIRDGAVRIAEKKDYRISRLSVMPDHRHIALRGNIKHSPQEIALSFQNNLAYMLGQKRIWDDGFYVGTFSEYDFGAIRAAVRNAAPK
jgi:REP element-mobilizing transposase RayT